MSSFATIKYKCNSYLYTRVHNYTKAKKRVKAIEYNQRKYQKLVDEIKIINKIKNYIYNSLNYAKEPKKIYIDLHFIKMLEYYIYLNVFHKNIQKLSYNESFLNYLKTKIELRGLDPREWDLQYKIVGANKFMIGVNQEVIYYYKNNLFV